MKSNPIYYVIYGIARPYIITHMSVNVSIIRIVPYNDSLVAELFISRMSVIFTPTVLHANKKILI